MHARAGPQRVATLVMSSLAALATLVLTAMPAGAILGADPATSRSGRSALPVE